MSLNTLFTPDFVIQLSHQGFEDPLRIKMERVKSTRDLQVSSHFH